MSGWAGPGGFADFSFRFMPGSCTLRYTQDGGERAVEIGTDGLRRLNRVQEAGSPLSKLCLHGWWSGAETFTVAARWIETCFEDLYHFTFAGDEVRVSREASIGGFGPAGQGEPVIAGRA